MSKNRMLERLRAKDKKSLFTRTQTGVGYPTGFLALDYRNGYLVESRDLDDNIISTRPSTGLVGGSFVTIVGKSGTAKTTGAIQMAANIVRNFETSFVQHYDLEQALTYTRIKNITGFTQRQLDSKYILKQEKTSIEDIMNSIIEICEEKEANSEDYLYDTGLYDEFNERIITYEPTFIIIDSIPTISSNDASKEMEGGTYANRVAKALSQFYKKLTPEIKKYNITVIAINHINAKMEINPFAKTQAQVNYLKQDESVPGGNAPIYYAHNLFKFVSNGKATMEKDGFDGFYLRVELIKSRTNKAGQSVPIAYNQSTGFDPILSLFKFAEDNKLMKKNGKHSYFLSNPDVKFNSGDFKNDFLTNEQIRYVTFESILPYLESQLEAPRPEDSEEENTVVNDMDLLSSFSSFLSGAKPAPVVEEGTKKKKKK